MRSRRSRPARHPRPAEGRGPQRARAPCPSPRWHRSPIRICPPGPSGTSRWRSRVVAAVHHPAAAARAARSRRARRAGAQEDRGEIERQRRLPDAGRSGEQQRVGRADSTTRPCHRERGRMTAGSEPVHGERSGGGRGQLDVSVDALRRVARGFAASHGRVARRRGLGCRLARCGPALRRRLGRAFGVARRGAGPSGGARRFGAVASAPASSPDSGARHRRSKTRRGRPALRRRWPRPARSSLHP